MTSVYRDWMWRMWINVEFGPGMFSGEKSIVIQGVDKKYSFFVRGDESFLDNNKLMVTPICHYFSTTVIQLPRESLEGRRNILVDNPI